MRRGYNDLPMVPCSTYGPFKRRFRSLVWRMSKRFTPKKRIPIVLTTGDRFVVQVGDQISEGIYSLGCHEAALTSILLPMLRPGMTVLDIGANIGYFTVMAAKRVAPSGRVHAFEINEKVLTLLKENIRVAGVDNVVVAESAVTQESGSIDFFVPKSGDEAEGTTRPSQRYDSVQKVTVPATSIDDYVSRNAIERVDLIKIDIEGGESAALSGAAQLLSGAHKPILFFEALDSACANHGITWLDTIDTVRRFGYRVYQIDTANYVGLPQETAAAAPVSNRA
jgi:FkbM family methyltransferase